MNGEIGGERTVGDWGPVKLMVEREREGFEALVFLTEESKKWGGINVELVETLNEKIDER